MRHELRSEVTIDASPETVWEVVTDKQGFEAMNTALKSGAEDYAGYLS